MHQAMSRTTFDRIKHEEKLPPKPYDFVNNLKSKNVVIEMKEGVVKGRILSYDENLNIRFKSEKGELTIPGAAILYIYEDKQ